MTDLRVAAIDCGTNSLRLLIAEPTEIGSGLRELTRVMRIVRLGEGVDRTGRLAPAALARTATVLAEFRILIDAAAATSVRMVATSAVRDAGNRAEFDAMVERALGLRADVVSGAQEAELSFLGACAGLADADASADLAEAGVPPTSSGLPSAAPGVLVADIGGGSTELVRGHARSGEIDAAVSLDVGSVRMTERHVRCDPPAADEVAAIERDVREALDQAGPSGWTDGDRLVGVAGTVTTVAALALSLERYDSARVHGAVLTGAEVDAAVGELLGLDRDQRAARAVIHPGRVDVIAAGAVILRALMHQLGAQELTVSEHDILDGIALGLRG